MAVSVTVWMQFTVAPTMDGEKQHYQLYENALRLVYNDYDFSFEELFEKDESYRVHHYNTAALAAEMFNPLSANATKWSNTLKQLVGKLPTDCLSVFDHFVALALTW